MNALRTLLTGLILVAASGAQATTASAPPGAAPPSAAPGAAAPAQWRTYDILVVLRNLPRTYSCDELWYKFRDVLLTLGARAYMTLTPYDCGYAGGGEARSPRVEAKFELPLLLHGSATRYAEISARNRTVRLAPGAPQSLKPEDCELVQQLEGTLLAGLPLRVDSASFTCTGSHASFLLSVEAPLAATAPAQGDRAAGATPQVTPHSRG